MDDGGRPIGTHFDSLNELLTKVAPDGAVNGDTPYHGLIRNNHPQSPITFGEDMFCQKAWLERSVMKIKPQKALEPDQIIFMKTFWP
ncbi:hypothetical protein JTB14_025549 [Gonioctena quinquepunctata]|nr:hypothetical protein JTB14_025549 [Gonioctena quinquepunctata]